MVMTPWFLHRQQLLPLDQCQLHAETLPTADGMLFGWEQTLRHCRPVAIELSLISLSLCWLLFYGLLLCVVVGVGADEAVMLDPAC